MKDLILPTFLYLAAFISAVAAITFMSDNLLAGVLGLLFAISLLPSTWARVESMSDRPVSWRIKFLFRLGLFILFVMVSSSATESIKPMASKDWISVEKVTETPTTTEFFAVSQQKSSEINSDYYPVVEVIDGDTVKVSIDSKIETIRLIGIDTPETKQSPSGAECFGEEASTKVKELLSGREVQVINDSTQNKRDKYDRLLAYIVLPDKSDVGEQLIREGFAHEYTYNKPYEKQAVYQVAEQSAKSNKLGLWSKESCLES